MSAVSAGGRAHAQSHLHAALVQQHPLAIHLVLDEERVRAHHAVALVPRLAHAQHGLERHVDLRHHR